MRRVRDRRGVLRAGAAACLAGLAGCLGGSDDDGPTDTEVDVAAGDPDERADWPTFQFDARNTGHAPGQGPTEDVDARWTFSTGETVYSSPAVVDGVVYVGNQDGTVYAVAADDGGALALRDRRRGSEFAGGRRRRRLRRQSGRTSLRALRRRRRSAGASRPRDGSGSPTVVDGVVYVRSSDNSLYAVSADDGTERGTFETGGSVQRAPAVADGTVYVASGDQSVYAVDVEDLEAEGGDEDGDDDGAVEARWEVATGDMIQSRPTVADGVVYVGSNDDTVYAIDADSGDVRWTFLTEGSVVSSPAVVDGVVYVGSFDTNLYALSADAEQADDEDESEDEPGNPEAFYWSASGFGQVRSSPAIVGDTIYVGNEDSYVYGLSARDGEIRWRFSTDGGWPVPRSRRRRRLRREHGRNPLRARGRLRRSAMRLFRPIAHWRADRPAVIRSAVRQPRRTQRRVPKVNEREPRRSRVIELEAD